MEDGLAMSTNNQPNKTPYVVAEVHTPVTEWTSATELLELESLLKEMVFGVISKAESNSRDNLQAQTTGFRPTAEEKNWVIAAIDREMERAKRQEVVFDWIGGVRKIATFTTITQHRKYFRTVMNQIDQIDKRKITLYKAFYLHCSALEKKRKAKEDAEVARRMEKLDKIWFEPLN